jgi:hypothetical protein
MADVRMVRHRMVMDKIQGHGRSRNIQFSQGEPSRRDKISRDHFSMNTL